MGRGSFGRLDVVVGAYEQYDDDLFGAKAFFGLALMLRDEAGTAELKERLQYLQAIEDALPIDRHRVVSSDIPVGTFDVIAAFGQGIEVNAEILPNDDAHPEVRPQDPAAPQLRDAPRGVARLERGGGPRWRRSITTSSRQRACFAKPPGTRSATTWAGYPALGAGFEDALAEDAAVIEELKAELAVDVRLLLARRGGRVHAGRGASVATAALLGGLRPVRPLRSQPYPTLWVMRLNHALENGYLRIGDDGLHIEHDRLADTVTSMLRETLAIQDGGTRAELSAFIERYSTWDERHERIAAALRAAEQHRFVCPALPARRPSGVCGRRGNSRQRGRTPGGTPVRPRAYERDERQPDQDRQPHDREPDARGRERLEDRRRGWPTPIDLARRVELLRRRAPGPA